MIAYVAVAALLGAGWFLVLLVPPVTREWLLAGRNQAGLHVSLLVASSVAVAWLFRGIIARAETWRAHLVRAATIPLAGCVIYLTLWNVWSLSRDAWRGYGLNLHDALVLYVWGLGSAVAAWYVMIPYGLLCQYVMNRKGQWSRRPGSR